MRVFVMEITSLLGNGYSCTPSPTLDQTCHLVTGAVQQAAKVQNIFDSSLKRCLQVPPNNNATKFYGNESGKSGKQSPSRHQEMRSHFWHLKFRRIDSFRWIGWRAITQCWGRSRLMTEFLLKYYLLPHSFPHSPRKHCLQHDTNSSQINK